jgi:hypothetical protein
MRKFLPKVRPTIVAPEAGFKAVKKNGGSPGTDGVTIQDFESRSEEEPVPYRRSFFPVPFIIDPAAFK